MVDGTQVWKVAGTSQRMYGSGLITALGVVGGGWGVRLRGGVRVGGGGCEGEVPRASRPHLLTVNTFRRQK
jgi:hypothetical protein